VVIEAVKQNGVILFYASEELRNDKDVVIEAVKENGFALKYASEELQNDEELIKLSDGGK
jgi:predicted methyltransferase